MESCHTIVLLSYVRAAPSMTFVAFWAGRVSRQCLGTIIQLTNAETLRDPPHNTMVISAGWCGATQAT